MYCLYKSEETLMDLRGILFERLNASLIGIFLLEASDITIMENTIKKHNPFITFTEENCRSIIASEVVGMYWSS